MKAPSFRGAPLREDTHLGVFASNAAKDCEREGDKGPDDEDDADGAKGQRGGGAVHNGHGVQEGEAGQHGPAEQRRCQQHVAHPVGAPHHLVLHRRHIACHSCRQCIQHLRACQGSLPKNWQEKQSSEEHWRLESHAKDGTFQTLTCCLYNTIQELLWYARPFGGSQPHQIISIRPFRMYTYK